MGSGIIAKFFQNDWCASVPARIAIINSALEMGRNRLEEHIPYDDPNANHQGEDTTA